MGAASARHSLRPLNLEGRDCRKARTRNAPRECVSLAIVIASQRVGANAPPDDELREAIHSFFPMRDGLLRRYRSSQ